MSGRGTRAAPGMAVLACVGVLLLAWLVVVRTPLFEVRRIRVEGNRTLSREEVVDLAGLRPGQNLLLLSSEGVEESLAADPRVASAEVVRDLPAGLTIRIRERRPVAWVRVPGGAALVAADGTVLERRARPPARLPLVGEAEAAPPAGAPVPRLGPGLAAAAALPPAVRRQVAEAVARDGRLVLVLRSGARALLGTPESLDAKASALRSLLRWSAASGVALDYVDLRVPAAPAVRPAPRTS